MSADTQAASESILVASLARVVRLAAREREVSRALVEVVLIARCRGASWERIALAVGVSEDEARSRFESLPLPPAGAVHEWGCVGMHFDLDAEAWACWCGAAGRKDGAVRSDV